MRSKSTRKAKEKPVEIGAVHALKRLENEEGRQFTRMKTAEIKGDALEIKAARDGWLKTSESLRKFDILIEAARRETGELVPRAQVEAWLHNAANWLHFSLIGPCDNSADKAFDTSKRTFEGFICSTNHSCPVPLWMGRALYSHCCRKNPDETLLRWRRVYHVQDALDRYPDDMAKVSRFVTEAVARDAAYLKEAASL